ncbi:MAG TPA: hypothetical protein VH164_11240 [Ktedonobacteraceae bacterium]|nr:hypothetical protein [Ktedonobacteraceae bacterium]
MNTQDMIARNNSELAWMLSHRPENRRVAEYVRKMGIPFTAEAYRLIFKEARKEEQMLGFNPEIIYELFIGYHELLANVATPTEACWKCQGEQEVVEYNSCPGFAGGGSYFTELACGHVNADESGDVAAAY